MVMRFRLLTIPYELPYRLFRMNTRDSIVFVDNPALQNRSEDYITRSVHVPDVLKSWKMSLFSFEWLNSDGQIKALNELPPAEQAKRRAVEQKLAASSPIEKPILGIGLTDNVEIGTGRAEFLTLAARGILDIPVHIPLSHESDFKPFLAGIE